MGDAEQQLPLTPPPPPPWPLFHWPWIWVVGTQAARLQVFPGKPHLMVGVVLGVGGPLSRLRWLWTGLCAGGTSGLRAGSLREKSETALCTAQEKEGRGVSRAPRPSTPLYLCPTD